MKSSSRAIATDVLIVGGGGAGLRAAIEAKRHGVDVLIVSHSRVGYGSNTTISGGAFAAVVRSSDYAKDFPDSPDQHLLDTIAGGYFLSNQSLVEIMVQGAEHQVEDLRRFGVRYTNARMCPWIALSTDPGHSYPRMVYGENSFGTDFTFPLRQYAIEQGVRFLEGTLVTKLLKKGQGVVGAMGINAQGHVVAIAAPATILTSGGLGQVYLRTDTTGGTTGDGYALAFEAGAILQDMEFVQFYPVGLGTGTPGLFYECFLLGTGGRLLNRLGEDIVVKHELTSPMLLTRDRLSRAIAEELIGGLGFEDRVVLDLTEVLGDKMKVLRPILPKASLRGELRFLVSPTAHFQMGGVKINERTETSVVGLYAAGEVCAGIHGANRLSGNALTELWVFGTIAGREAAQMAKEAKMNPLSSGVIAAETRRLQQLAAGRKSESPEPLRQSLRETMWHRAGLVRDAQGLKQALNEIDDLKERHRHIFVDDGRGLVRAVRLGNMLTVSEMICRTALCRNESRGAHYRRDSPTQNNDDWLCNVRLTKKGGQIALGTERASLTKLSPQG